MSDSVFKILVIAALAITLVLDAMDMVDDADRVAQITELDQDVDRIAQALNVSDGDDQ